MPITPITLQRRHAELGRIRLGHKASTSSGGSRPAKLEAFRFTSPSERYIRDLAKLYGGEAREWDNSGKPEWEVYSEAKSIPVIAVKGGLSQWLEHWSGGGCKRRCDGEHEVLGDRACVCDPADRLCKPTTRLSMMLPELEAIGVWRLESHGWNAAAEIPAVAELAQFVGDLVPANLHLVERRSVKDGQTSRFVVPVLDLQIGTAKLRELVDAKLSGAAELGPAAGGGRPALEAGSSAEVGSPASAEDPYTKPLELVAAATDHDRLVWIWDKAKELGIVGTGSEDTPRRQEFIDAWKAKAHQIQDGGAQPDADGAYPIETVDDGTGDADAVWQRILAAAGQQGMNLEQVVEAFKEQMGGLPDEATAAEMSAFLGKLEQEPAA